MLFGILLFFIVGTFSFILVQGTQNQPLIKDYYGNDVSPTESYVWGADQNGEIIKNPDGTFTRTIGGDRFIDDKTQPFPHYVPWNSSFFPIIDSNYLDYEYQLDTTYSDYQAYFQDNIQAGKGFRFQVGDYWFTYDLSGGKMQWSEQDGNPTKTKSVGSILSSSPTNNSNTITYSNAFLNTNVEYEMQLNGVKENFILNSMPDGSTGYLYLEYTGELQFDNNLTIWANGEEQTSKSFTTSGAVEFKDSNGNTVFKMPSPVAYDSNNSQVSLVYDIKPNIDKLTFELKTPISFLENAVYPVRIDPTVVLQTADTENLKDSYVNQANSTSNYGTSTTLWIEDTTSSNGYNASRIYMSFNLSQFPDSNKIYSIEKTNLTIYADPFCASGEVSLNEVYNNWINGTGSNILNENEINWNNQPCGTNFDNSTNCNLTTTYTSPEITCFGYKTFDLMGLVDRYILNSQKNVSFAMKYSDESGSARSNFKSKESSNSSLYPKLTIVYTPYINIISPTTSQIFNQDSPTAELNISTGVAMDSCFYSNTTTNYSMTAINSTYFYVEAGSNLLDGSHSLTFWCNESSGGSWHQSDSISFEVDPINITRCRNLNENRTYELVNKIDHNSSLGHCIRMYGSGGEQILEGNYNLLNMTGNSGLGNSIIYIHGDENSNTTLNNINISAIITGSNGREGIYSDKNNKINITNSYIFFNETGSSSEAIFISDFGLTASLYTDNLTLSVGNVQRGIYFYGKKINLSNSIILGDTQDSIFTDGLIHIEYISNNSEIKDSTVNQSGSSEEIYLDNAYNEQTALNLINVTRNKYIESVISDGRITSSWYQSVYINDTLNNRIENANVTIYDNSTLAVYSELTNSSGQIPKQTIREYVHNTTGIFYDTPHNISSVKFGYSLNYTIINLSLVKNFDSTILLSKLLEINIISPESINYSSNESLNLSFNYEGNSSNIDLCWFKITNSTGDIIINNKTIIGCTNTTFNVPRADQYTLDIWINQSDSSSATNSKAFGVDLFPTIVINTITTTVGSQSVTFNTTISDTNLDTCTYTVYNLAGGIEGVLEDISFNCINGSFSVSSFATYNLSITANDTAGNSNNVNQSFTTTATAGDGGGGGGGGSTTVIIGGEAGWIMEVSEDNSLYDISMPKGTSRTLTIDFENIGDSSRELTLSCVDGINNGCDFVTIDEPTFTLPLIKDTKTTRTFTVTIPDELPDDDYRFNIRATDDLERTGDISVIVRVGTQNFLVEIISKFGLKTKGGIPYFLIFIVPLIILFPLSLRLIKEKTPLRAIWIILIGIGIPLFLVYLF